MSANTRSCAQARRALQPLGAPSCVPSSGRGRGSLSSSPASQLTERGEDGDASGGSGAARLRPRGSPFLGNSQFPVQLRGGRGRTGLLLVGAPRGVGAARLGDRGPRTGAGTPAFPPTPFPTPEALLGPLPAQAQSAWRRRKRGGGQRPGDWKELGWGGAPASAAGQCPLFCGSAPLGACTWSRAASPGPGPFPVQSARFGKGVLS